MEIDGALGVLPANGPKLRTKRPRRNIHRLVFDRERIELSKNKLASRASRMVQRGQLDHCGLFAVFPCLSSNM